MEQTQPTVEEPQPLLGLEGVSVDFAGQQVLRGLTVMIPRGQTLAVIGESGCGKTVFLKLLIGLLRPSTGRVVFDGKDLGELKEKDLNRQRLRFGFLFQGAALFDSLSIFDNVAFGLRTQRKLGEEQIQERVRLRLHEVGLKQEEVESKKPAQLSGGMKKRVGLARALALDPEVMLYDEPTTGLDPIMSDVINQLIVQTRQQHPVTSIVVTHDMKTTRAVADRVVMLYPLAHLQGDESQIIFDGSPAELANCSDSRVRQFVEGKAA